MEDRTVGRAPVLEVARLTRTYDAGGGVREVSFSVGEGETVGLLGPNGSGKSTTLHCLAGIIPASAGAIRFAGIPHDDAAAKDVFGFLPDDLPLPESLRLPEVLALHRRLRPVFDEALAAELVELVGLAGHRGKYIGEYSHGMKRKLQLVTALSHRPRMLILDEPMRGLDPEAGILLRTLLEVFTRQGGAVLLATHDLAAAEDRCDRVVILSGGRVLAEGAPQALLDEYGANDLEAYFVRITGLESALVRTQREIRSIIFASDVHQKL